MHTSTQNLIGKVAFVQGGSRGIGAAIARRLATDGAAVAFSYHASEAAAQALAAEIEAAGGRALAIRADAADEAAIEASIATAVETFGRLDILVANAGVLAMAPIDAFPTADLDRTLAVNVRGVVLAGREAARRMGEGGRIVFIGSTNAERMPFAGGAVYAMSKSALVGLTKGMARDLGPRGITVNTVAPGPVDTDMNPAEGEFADALRAMMPVARYAHVDEIADLVRYLSGPDAGYITGAHLGVDGGFSA